MATMESKDDSIDAAYAAALTCIREPEAAGFDLPRLATHLASLWDDAKYTVSDAPATVFQPLAAKLLGKKAQDCERLCKALTPALMEEIAIATQRSEPICVKGEYASCWIEVALATTTMFLAFPFTGGLKGWGKAPADQWDRFADCVFYRCILVEGMARSLAASGKFWFIGLRDWKDLRASKNCYAEFSGDWSEYGPALAKYGGETPEVFWEYVVTELQAFCQDNERQVKNIEPQLIFEWRRVRAALGEITARPEQANREEIRALGQIPPDERTRPMSYKDAAYFLGKGRSKDAAEWVSKCVKDGTIPCEDFSRQKHVFSKRSFPEGTWPSILQTALRKPPDPNSP